MKEALYFTSLISVRGRQRRPADRDRRPQHQRSEVRDRGAAGEAEEGPQAGRLPQGAREEAGLQKIAGEQTKVNYFKLVAQSYIS